MSASGTLLGLLPLLTAGFIFNVLFYRTRFEVTPAEGQRLFFMSATAGLLLGVVAYPLSAMLPQRWLLAGANIYHVKEAAPLLFAMLLAPVLALVGNALYWFWKDALNIEDWTKVIAIDQIEVASIYDESAFQAWFKPISTA